MSLDEKTRNPLAPAGPSQNLDLLPKAGKKRRKGEGSSSRKAKKIEIEEEDDSADVTAVLTMGDTPRKQPKKMLFEPDDAGPVSLPPSPARKDTGSTRAALSTTAAVMPAPVPQAATTPLSAAPASKTVATAPESVSTAPVESSCNQPEPQPAPALPIEPEPESPPPVADMKGSVFQVATLVMRAPESAPELQPTEQAQATLDLGTVGEATPEHAVGAETVEDMTPDLPEVTADAPAETPVEVAASETESSPPEATETAAAAGSVEDHVAAPMDPAPVQSEIALEASQTAAESIRRPAVDTPAPAPATQKVETSISPVPAAVPPKAPPAEPESSSRDRGTAGLSRSEMIARTARLSALSSSRSNGSTAAPVSQPRPPAPPTPPQQQHRPTELPKHAGDLYGYWTRLKNGRRFPSRADFDVEQMAENFPNSMLLTCSANGGSQVNFSSILRLGANRRSQPGETLNFTSMITEWILAIGGEAVRVGTPVQDTEVFPSPDGTFAYKIVALPLSEQQTRVDHVLCHLSRS
jgi:hypothetical protein